MLKLLGAILIIGSCGTFGLAARQRLSARIQALSAMIDALNYIGTELSYQQTPLPEIITALAENSNFRIARLYREIANRMTADSGLSLSFHWQTAVRDLYSELGLTEEDSIILRECIGYLGRYQVEQQLSGLEHTKVKLERERETACEQLKTKGQLYRTCGIAGGVAAVLILL